MDIYLYKITSYKLQVTWVLKLSGTCALGKRMGFMKKVKYHEIL